jgi:hypothetical protein
MESSRVVASCQDRSRQTFCPPVRGLALAEPPTKARPPRWSYRLAWRRVSADVPLSEALFRNKRAPGQGVVVVQSYTAVAWSAEALPGSGAPAQNAWEARRPCGALQARHQRGLVCGGAKRLTEHTPRATHKVVSTAVRHRPVGAPRQQRGVQQAFPSGTSSAMRGYHSNLNGRRPCRTPQS